METTFGKVINTALDAGIRLLMPDLIEEQVVDVKDAIINNGFKAGVKEAIDSAIGPRKKCCRNIYWKF